MEAFTIQDMTIVTKAKTRKLKRKDSYSDELQIDVETYNLIEELNKQVDKIELEARKAAMNYIVRK